MSGPRGRAPVVKTVFGLLLVLSQRCAKACIQGRALSSHPSSAPMFSSRMPTSAAQLVQRLTAIFKLTPTPNENLQPSPGGYSRP